MKYYYLKRYSGFFYYHRKSRKWYGYRYTYYDSNHKRHERKRTGFINIRNALSNLHAVANRQQALKNSHSVTFAQWCEHVIREKSDSRTTTYKAYAHLLRLYVIPYLGHYKLIDLTPLIYKYRCWTKLLKRGLAENTVKDVNAKVQAVMNEAVNEMVIPKNRLKHTDLSRIARRNHRPRKQIMTQRQLQAFNRVLNHQPLVIQVMYYTLEETGIRVGELLGLHWKDVNLADQTINIEYTRDAYGLRPPKTNNSHRRLTVSQRLNNLLKSYHKFCKQRYQINEDSYVVLGRFGKPLIPKIMSTKLKQLLIKSNLKSLVGHFSCHTFRHQFASRLIVDYHVDPLTVSRILGHASPAITMKIYAQLSRQKSMNIGKLLK